MGRHGLDTRVYSSLLQVNIGFLGAGQSSRGGNQLRLMLKPVVLPRWRPRQAAVCATRLGQLCLGGCPRYVLLVVRGAAAVQVG